MSRRSLLYCSQDRVGQATSAQPQVGVVYFFHGLGGNVNDLFGDAGRVILDGLQRIYGSNMPIVVSLSLGDSGVLGDETPEVTQSGLVAIESLIAPGKTFERIVIGGSMGGHNALRLVAQAPRQFKAVAALCPALATFNGHNQAEVDAYVQRNAAVLDREFFDRAIAVYREELPTPEIWNANNPFTFLDQGAYDGLPIFLSVGREDTLGFLEGAREFKRRADLRPAMIVDYHEVSGGHCVFDVPAFLRFMYERSR